MHSWDRPDVSVEIEKRGPTKEAVDGLEINASQDGDRIELEVKKPRRESFTGIGISRSTSARLIVSVPRRADVTARTGDGSIRIERVNGRLELRSGDGSIRASEVSGDLVLNTGDGSITVDGAEGTLRLQTGDGGVSVAGKLTSVKMHTGDGSIVYRAQPGTSMQDDWDISTGDGSVALYLPRVRGRARRAQRRPDCNELSIGAPRSAIGRRTEPTHDRGPAGAGGRLRPHRRRPIRLRPRFHFPPRSALRRRISRRVRPAR